MRIPIGHSQQMKTHVACTELYVWIPLCEVPVGILFDCGESLDGDSTQFKKVSIDGTMIIGVSPMGTIYRSMDDDTYVRVGYQQEN